MNGERSLTSRLPPDFGAELGPISTVTNLQGIHMTRLRFFLAIPLVLCCLIARADRVDDFVREQMNEQHIPGLSLAIVRDGKVTKAKGYGFANLEWRAPVTPE